MKNLVFIFSLTFILFYSCSSNSDENTAPEEVNYLIGKWYLNKIIYNNQQQTLSDCNKSGYITFNTNDTFEREYYFFNGTNCLTETADNGTYSYDMNNNKITLSFVDVDDGDQIEVLNIIDLTATSFKYVWDEDNNGANESQMEFIK